MNRFFNTAGPIRKKNHYCIDPLTRIDLSEILSLINQEKYFVLHAPWQTGKTSYLIALMDYLNKQGKYSCLYSNLEAVQAARENVKEGIGSVLSTLASDALDYLNDTFIEDNWRQIFKKNGAFTALKETLKQWCKTSSKPVVLFFDEVDSLVGDTLISLLRQLRSGYSKRPGMFPQSIILCGVRDVRDYRIHSDKEKTVITGGSAFNIKAKSLRLGNFNLDEIKMLYEQHTTDTGQSFYQDVFQLVWELTEGQPWLVNAMAYEACFEMKAGQDRERPITRDMLLQAKENLILRRETHLDQLADKLSEERVRRVIEPILSGSNEAEKIPVDDVDYAVDLGLIKKAPQLKIANRIYQEVIPRELIYTTQLTINQDPQWYIDNDGYLNMDKLLRAFQVFFRKHFEHWVDGFNYSEAGPQLLLQAFLQRIVNSGGRVEREYGLGRQRTDLLVIWPYKKGTQQAVLELKIKYGSLEKTIEQGLEQTREYMDKCGTNEGYLLVFNRAEKTPWQEKIFKQKKTFKGVTINVYGL
ncbi:MAG: ATP-binding protein [Candidatus Aminicenantes bacterium]|nr:ATP-binding protein [Candidatus Aminicenantes bacterium]NIM83015.1 ATP-binding protein [Candidatus Aminicenantes bacterium]NIN22401.1 ATP-binding protein [Candidatus Aminicenantes bacterium]NIN46169.1 ATP-binding protein [Candidatus Aminicenantes bacterium]NIN89007.1 ATP-binding protein [Candidatus Aminicenantes bacterium]